MHLHYTYNSLILSVMFVLIPDHRQPYLSWFFKVKSFCLTENDWGQTDVRIKSEGYHKKNYKYAFIIPRI